MSCHLKLGIGDARWRDVFMLGHLLSKYPAKRNEARLKIPCTNTVMLQNHVFLIIYYLYFRHGIEVNLKYYSSCHNK